MTKSDTGDDAQILTDLTAVSRYLERCLGRFFNKDAAVVARYFVVPGSLRQPFATPPLGWAESENPYRYGVWTRTLAIDELASTSGLQIVVDDDRDGLFDETALATTDYELWPLNAAVGPEPSPWSMILLPSWSTCQGFASGVRVKVTGIWGWPAVPVAIMEATCHLTGILRLESPRATSRVNEMGETLSTSREAQDIVRELQRKYVARQSVI